MHLHNRFGVPASFRWIQRFHAPDFLPLQDRFHCIVTHFQIMSYLRLAYILLLKGHDFVYGFVRNALAESRRCCSFHSLEPDAGCKV
jgi:hypothetical protein